jgi:hypothetical protein
VLLLYGGSTGSNGDPNAIIVALFRASVPSALCAQWADESFSQWWGFSGSYLDAPSSTSAQTYSLRAGVQGGGGNGVLFNQSTPGNRKLGGVQEGAWLVAMEVKQ